MTHKSVSIQNIMLNSDSHIGKLITKARELKQLNASFHELVGDELANCCSIEHFQDGILEIMVSNPSLATKLRFLEPTILQSLRKNPTWMGLRSLKVKTHPGI